MDLRRVLHVLRTSWLSIVICTVIGGLLGFGFAATQPREYTANASGLVSAGVSTDMGSALAGESLAKSRVKSYLDVAHSRSVAEIVIDNLGLSTSPNALVGNVTATNPVDTAVIEISVTATTPDGAAQLAEAWIEAIGVQVGQLENAEGDDTGTPSIVTFRTLDSAVTPTAPSRPNVPMLVAIGLLGGLAVGLSQAFVRAYLDRRIRRPSQVEEELGVPVVGNLPYYAVFDKSKDRVLHELGSNDRRATPEGSAMAESLRELRTNLRFMNVDKPPDVITITSSLPGEGKSTAAVNLALTIADNGERVVLIDGDLRRPTIAKSLGLPGGVGLTDVLIGEAELDDVLQPVGDGNLLVLGAGPIPPNPSELLGSQAMQHLLADLAQENLVLIDAPPLLPVTDAAVLSAVTDGAVLVGRCGSTTLDAAELAVASINRIQGTVLGFIINAVPLRGGHSYAYRYNYRYGYATSDKAPPPTTSPRTRRRSANTEQPPPVAARRMA